MKYKILLVLALCGFFVAPIFADSIHPTLTGTQTGPDQWTYTLTFAPLVNYSIFPVSTQSTNLTTITLTGLFGVTNLGGPTSTDFPSAFINAVNLDWTAQVLNGGTEVQWTHVGPGTGNFNSVQNVFGFSISAPGAVNGIVSLATSGFSRDTTNPLPDATFNLDITGTTNGPVGPVPEPSSLLLLGTGLLGLVGAARRKWMGRRSEP